MPNEELRYSLNAVKRAGKRLRDWDEYELKTLVDVLPIVENWRDCHSFPMTQFYDSLRECGAGYGSAINVVQRPKRLESIIGKLKANPAMALTTMQDIAGCRAILPTNELILPFVDSFRRMWDVHELYDTDDYIAKPKANGYRSLHLIYRFHSDNPSFDGRFVEIQFRSRFQHAWATALETVDLFEGEQLKAGKGDSEWHRFFALMGSVVAAIENAVRVPGTPVDESDQELRRELRHYAEVLEVERRMRAYGSLTFSTDISPVGSMARRGVSSVYGRAAYSGATNPAYFLLELYPHPTAVRVRGYERRDIAQASRDLVAAERERHHVVLVAASDLAALKEAYPNWIIDTRYFLSLLQFALR